jgi:hypothetical protein
MKFDSIVSKLAWLRSLRKSSKSATVEYSEPQSAPPCTPNPHVAASPSAQSLHSNRGYSASGSRPTECRDSGGRDSDDWDPLARISLASTAQSESEPPSPAAPPTLAAAVRAALAAADEDSLRLLPPRPFRPSPRAAAAAAPPGSDPDSDAAIHADAAPPRAVWVLHPPAPRRTAPALTMSARHGPSGPPRPAAP